MKNGQDLQYAAVLKRATLVPPTCIIGFPGIQKPSQVPCQMPKRFTLAGVTGGYFFHSFF